MPKAKLFQKAKNNHPHFYLPPEKINVQVRFGHRVLSRLVSCIGEIGLAC
jgi:hypothetical protein